MSNEDERARSAVRSYKDIRAEYSFDDSIFCEEDERVHLIKDIVLNRLNEVDRTIILLYADCQSLRKLGARLGMSCMTVRREILRIRAEIMKMYNEGIR